MPSRPAIDLEGHYVRRSQQFSATVRELRRRANTTLQQIAERSGLSASTLSKIENGQLSPTYETLLRLAHGLRVDIAQLFSPESSTSSGRRSVTRRGQGHLHTAPPYEYEMLCADLFRKQFTPLIARITARDIADFPEWPCHEGEEFIYVLSGEIELHTQHYEPTRLRQGDSCYFDSTMRHACICVGRGDATVLWIASRPHELAAHASRARPRAHKRGSKRGRERDVS
jgi:transcriptional regulator with XRE-family HTH domain